MSYNLNFYPNDYNNSAFNTQYVSPYQTADLNLQKLQQETENRLKQISQMTNNIGVRQPHMQQNVQQQEQPYYLFCGNKTDWDEFLMLNYNITEQNIFDDYKLFLQAKQEVLNEKGQTRINAMKDKIRGNNTRVQTDGIIQSNVKPNKNTQSSNINGDNNRFNMGDNNKLNNGLLGANKQQSKNVGRKA